MMLSVSRPRQVSFRFPLMSLQFDTARRLLTKRDKRARMPEVGRIYMHGRNYRTRG